ncbi:L-arginine ABC transporter membrane protein /L-ornithine ABC transporter membrane protein [Ruegeria halocynthiae]|uniref:L-arginine ABC transporter membrane protein /L-ornithine ABC transporter membrane protein n=1 Tax=Ruegeria halocynthiae TaxID=985054 RepID=A0A1H2ZMN8_9RHOB|nr:ABC transporter permease [Ruegeria halocynthiae]SDX18625.1 L-arginine ABC transporter membrane protein /L-ornithine ABC transporter membrane protein [Ruegeria halocynthiae]
MENLLNAVQTFSAENSPLDFYLVLENWRLFWKGLQNTLLLLVLSLVAGGLLAIPLAIIRATRVPVLNPIAFGFIYFVRGTPLLVQLYVIYYGLSQFEAIRDSAAWVILRDPWWCALISFSIGTAAYTAEIFRGAISDTPRGEVEATIAAGMSRVLAYRRIILPSAFRRALPAYGNEVIFNLHTTVIASTVTVIDVLGAARTFNNKYYLAYEGFITAALIFIAIVFVITRVFNLMERRMLRHLKRA